MSEQQHADNLNASRADSLKNSAGNARKNIQTAKNAANVASLMQYIDPFMDWLFGIALAFAILKDILDILNTALIAAGGVGWFLIMLFTGACSLAIFFIMLITGASGKTGMAKGIAKRIVALLVATGAEMIPGIGLLPMESIVVIIILWMTLAERKTAAQGEGSKNASIEPSPASSGQKDALSELNDKKDRTREDNVKLIRAREIMERNSISANDMNDPVLMAAYKRAQQGENVFKNTHDTRNGFKFANDSYH